MDFKMTEEQELLLEGLREVIARYGSEEYFRECDENHRYPTEWMKAMTDNGFGLLGVPEEYGGTSVDTLTLMLVTEEATRLGCPSYFLGRALYIDDMMRFGSEEQKKVTMEYALKGEYSFCLGFTEPQSGSDSTAITATATRKNGKVYINGNKTFITGADKVPYMLCMTRDLESTKTPYESCTLWWVPMNAQGIKVVPLNKVGWHMKNTCEVFLDNVEIEEKDIVGKEGEGFKNLMHNFEIERLQMAAGALGQAQCAFEDAIRYANQRVQFGKTIGSFQLIQEKLCDMAIKIKNMKNFVYQTAWEKDNGIPINVSAALCKLYCAQAGFEVIDDAMQILGGIGYTDVRVSRMWRDSRVNRIGGGTDQIMIHVAGRALLKQYK